jgi:hypothetical protein
MVDREALEAYVAEIERARKGAGLDFALLDRPCPDLPDERIAREGFETLDDSELAEIAVDPTAVETLSEYLWGEVGPEPERGDWWWTAVTSGESAEPGLVRSVVELQKQIEEREATREPEGRSDGGSVLPFEPGRVVSRPGGGWRGLGRFAALAASLLVGVFLGRFAFQGDRSGPERFAASASASYGAGRGVERSLGVQFESNLFGFATVVAVAPGRRPEVFPALGRDDVEVRAGAPSNFGPLPAGTREALVVVAETPSADPIRRALRASDRELPDADSVREMLEPYLQTKGYRRFAFATTTFSPE